jgi:hypothetical protein
VQFCAVIAPEFAGLALAKSVKASIHSLMPDAGIRLFTDVPLTDD